MCDGRHVKHFEAELLDLGHVIVTSITRGGEVVLPSGDTVLAAGDRLSLLGERKGLEAIGEIRPLASASA